MSDLNPDNKPKSETPEDLNTSFRPNAEYYQIIGAEYFANGRALLGSREGRAKIMAALQDEPDRMWPESAEWIVDNLRGKNLLALKHDNSMGSWSYLMQAAQLAITEDCDVLISYGSNFAVANPGDAPGTLKDKVVAHKRYFDFATEFFDADRIQLFSPDDLEHMLENYGFDLAANENFVAHELDGSGFKLMRVDPGQTLEVCAGRAIAAADKFKSPVVFVFDGGIHVVDQHSTETGVAAMAALRRFLKEN